MEKRNPLLTGLFNMLVPGICYWYVDHDRGRSIKAFTVGIALVACMIVLGNAIQTTRGYALPQGLCTGILLLIVLAPLFLMGQKIANQHNSAADNNAKFNANRPGWRASQEAKLKRIGEMRDEGSLPEQEPENKKTT
jgi:hypothetical protein